MPKGLWGWCCWRLFLRGGYVARHIGIFKTVGQCDLARYLCQLAAHLRNILARKLPPPMQGAAILLALQVQLC
jgi:hypothetical protein